MKTVSVIVNKITLKEKLLVDLTNLGYSVLASTVDNSDVLVCDNENLPLFNENDSNRAVVAMIDEIDEEAIGLLAEADDILILPYNIDELGLRLKLALIRRGSYDPKPMDNTLIVDGIVINFDSYEVLIDNAPLDLTFKEYELLRCLITNRGRVYTRDQLLNSVWGYDYYGGARTVDVHIRRLRAKLGKYESLIETVRNVGYRVRK